MTTTTNLQEYIRRRIEALGKSPTELSTQLGWSPSYLTNLIGGQFKPSEERCRKLAREFGDDPNLILSLAGYYTALEEHESAEIEDFARYRSLKPAHRSLTRLFMDFLRSIESVDHRESSSS